MNNHKNVWGINGHLRPSFFRFSLWFAALVFILFSGWSCVRKARIIHEPSSVQRPGWIETLPQNDDELYFVGISTSGDTLEDTRKAAVNDAVSQISRYLGTTVYSKFESVTTDTAHDISLQLKTDSQALVRQARIVDSYHEITRREGQEYSTARVDAYVLVGFSKNQVDKELDRQEKEIKKQIKTAAALYQKGLACEASKDFLSARRHFMDAREILETSRHTTGEDVAGEPSARELSILYDDAARRMTSLVTCVCVTVRTNTSEQGNRTFISHVSSILTSRGFSVHPEHAMFEIQAEISLAKGGFVMNNHVSYAQGTIRVIQKSDNASVIEIPVSVKGFHKNIKQSEINALKEAGTEGGQKTAEAILKLIANG